jgi:hypothetical protein
MVYSYNYCVFGYYPSSGFYLKHDVSETRFCLRLQAKNQPHLVLVLVSGDRVQLSRFLPEDGYRIQSPKRCFK